MNYHRVYNAYGAGDYLNNLRAEFDEIPHVLRCKWLRKSRQRAWMLALTGQTLLEQQKIPMNVKRVLWFYDWNTIGDSIMDLSQRQSLADRYELDICMPNGPSELFVGDRAFKHIFTDARQCRADYDFILLHDISSRSISFKLCRYFFKPWASMIRHQQGEQYARGALSAFRLAQLLDSTGLTPRRPSIARHCAPQKSSVIKIAVALGGGDPRRRYIDWYALLREIQQRVPAKRPIKFLLLGAGPSSQEDLRLLPNAFVETNCEIALDMPGLNAVCDVLCMADFFIGCDSGLMHLAEALDIPGLALFGHIRPEWRLLPESRLLTRFDPSTVNNMQPSEIVDDFVRVFEEECRL